MPHWQRPGVALYAGDAHTVLAHLPAASVDCIVTSPPYFGLRDYGTCGQYGLESTAENYVANLVAVFAQARRTLSDRGTAWIVIGDGYISSPTGRGDTTHRYRIHPHTPSGASARRPKLVAKKNLIGIPWRLALALQADGWWLRSATIWHKPNAMPESVIDRPALVHEYILMLTKQPRYYFNLDAIRVPHAAPTVTRHPDDPRPDARRRGHKYRADNPLLPPRHRYHSFLPDPRQPYGHPGGRNPGSVWSIPSQSSRDTHCAPYPIDIPRRAIAAGCPPEGVVLDPFHGSGTTGVAAIESGRRYIGIDLNPHYLELSIRRLIDSQDGSGTAGADADEYGS